MVWTPETRERVGDVGCGGRLSDGEFALLSPMLPPAKPGGRPRTTALRGVLDGLIHVLRTGCQWRHLPAAYPPWQTVYGYWRAFIAAGVWDDMLHVLPTAARGRLPLGHPLRRQRLCRPDGRNRVSGAWRLPAHHHRQRRRRARLSRAAKALGGRAHPRLALSKPPSLQGLRTSARRQRSLRQTRDDPPHDRSIDMNHTSKTDSEEPAKRASRRTHDGYPGYANFQSSQSHTARPMTSSRSWPLSQGNSSVNIVTHCSHEHGMRVMSVPQKKRCGPNAS